MQYGECSPACSQLIVTGFDKSLWWLNGAYNYLHMKPLPKDIKNAGDQYISSEQPIWSLPLAPKRLKAKQMPGLSQPPGDAFCDDSSKRIDSVYLGFVSE